MCGVYVCVVCSGDAVIGGGGAGGGGASIITQITVNPANASLTQSLLVLVAAGGGGGGSTDYCCADGGFGGHQFTAGNGTSPGENAPWPLTNPAENRVTPIIRRFEYTSHSCPEGEDGQYCISVWDVLPGSLPAAHSPLLYGQSPLANYSVWSTGGFGARNTSGGFRGTSGSFVARKHRNCSIHAYRRCIEWMRAYI